MALRKRIHRLVWLIDLLTSARSHTADELARLCGVSRRTVFRDLSTLRDAELPIRFDEERKGFSLDRQPYLKPADFTVAESLSLFILCDNLAKQENGIPFQSAARTAALKLLSNLPRQLRDQVGELSERTEVRIGARNKLEGAHTFFDLVNQAIQERRQIRVRYDSFFEGQEIGTAISPYRLIFQTRSWYVIGRSSVHRSVRTFNIGRIKKAELLETRFTIPPRFSLKRYFGHAWSMIRERNEHSDVRIRFQKKVARNVQEVNWHSSQRVEENGDGSVDITFQVEGLQEISWWILGYGKEAEVISPPELRAIVADHAKRMTTMYRKSR